MALDKDNMSIATLYLIMSETDESVHNISWLYLTVDSAILIFLVIY